MAREAEQKRSIVIPIAYKFLDVDGLTVLEFTGVDDACIKPEELEDAVCSQSQLIVFITNYRWVNADTVDYGC